MTNRITIELTADQANDLITLIEGWLPSSEWWLKEYEHKQASGYLAKYQPRNWTQERYDATARKIAYRKRLLTKLAKAKTL